MTPPQVIAGLTILYTVLFFLPQFLDTLLNFLQLLG
jgi:hypothetical protein